MQMLRVAIADDHDVLVEGLKALFTHPEHGFEVACTAHHGAELLQRMRVKPVDLILLDLNMPGGDGLEFLPRIREQYPSVKVIIFTMYDQPKFIKEAFRRGADGYILKGSRFQELLDGMRMVAEGQIYLSEGLTVFPGTNGESEDEYTDSFLMLHSLTKRELEILTLIAKAKSTKEIAEELFISDQTVSVHRKNLMRKLRVTSSAGLMKFVVEKDLLNQ